MTDEQRSGTSGGEAGTSGLSARALTALLLAAMFLFGLVRIAANVYSYIADRQGAGLATSPTIAWLLEGCSLVAWAVMMIPCWFSVRHIRPPRFGLAATAAIHALLAIPVSLGHIALMVAFRTATWWATGNTYHFTSPDGSPLLYEMRKDVSAYVELVFILFLVQWLVARYAAAAPAPPQRQMLAVGDGSVTHHLPVDEIEHVAAAGNYVEIAWKGQRLLHRTTLSAIEAELAGAGFARIHRSRLARKAAIRRVVTQKSGDFDVEMDSGETLRGSRRYRPNIEG
ncbi:LytTR family DNA-binding domain-containing protein [Sphingopyxis indica]|uniref:DNA-binding response regulator, LytR/AlgR family n=1 Tax=Sphingopyxis indica TaxID=436663 RepID=A0A239J0P9_9SPHN|nr:LytTR family DNA-binding domain-containing protein [Sphingopyxis indica]SNS99212.1 DNA-binding response regulator, LytR/AlgR family [Sphingopyxis indica]